MARLAALLLSVTAFVVAAPTHADSFSTLPVVQRADELLTQTLPTPVVERADALLMRALPMVFQYGNVEQRTIPAFATAHHTVTLAEYTMHVSSKLDLRAGAGMAEIVDAPVTIDMQHNGPAVGGAINCELARVKGLRVALDFSALHVRYGSIGMTDSTMLVELSAK